MRNPENPKAEDRIVRELRFELSAIPEGREAGKILREEYERRIAVLKNALGALNLSEESLVIVPPVSERTDFGYGTDLDIIFFGSQEQGDLLHSRLYEEGGLFADIDCIGQERLSDIKNKMPEFYDFLTDRRGKIPFHSLPESIESSRDAGKRFLEQAESLEAKIRTVVSPEDKANLKEYRLAIGRQFIKESAEKIKIVATAFSGSMMEDMDRFSINSDLDIDLVIDSPDTAAEDNAREWLLYLKLKYALEYGIKADVFPTELEHFKNMAAFDKDMTDFYQRYFGVNFSE
ncbi:MAG: hypothetical protein PHU56_00640 [Candidatus Pacebacteria bacterium]|nr:hypothetical protein [Candidatus Paceibacterota bacterium]